MTEPGNEDRAGLAAEYALGTLSEAEKAQANALIRTDKAFADEVRLWESRFNPMLLAVPAASPPAGSFDRIIAAIEGPALQLDAELIQLRRRVTAWKWTSLAAGAIAASIFVLAIMKPFEKTRPSEFVAVIEAADRTPAFLATLNEARGELSIKRLAAPPRRGRSFELWAIREGAAPESLGVVEAFKRIPARAITEKTGEADPTKLLLAITDETEGGSPTGQPTSAPIFTGKLIQAPSS